MNRNTKPNSNPNPNTNPAMSDCYIQAYFVSCFHDAHALFFARRLSSMAGFVTWLGAYPQETWLTPLKTKKISQGGHKDI